MLENTKNKVNYIEGQKKGITLPIIFLIIVLVITISLFIYNSYLKKQISDLISKVESMTITAEELENRSDIQVYSLLDNNEETIKELEKRSQISKYINHLKSLESPSKYGIKFEGFVITRGEISTTAMVESSDKLAYQKTVNFIKGYRDDKNALLNLKFIDLIEGMDNIKFNVNFSIK